MSPRAGLDAGVILQAAAEIADREGFAGVTLAALAATLGVRTPSLYNHIDGLPALRSRLALHALQQLTRQLEASAGGAGGEAAVRGLAAGFLTFAREHPGLYESTLRAPEPGEAELERAAARLVETAVAAFAGMGLAGEAAIHAVRGFRSLTHGFISLERAGGFGMPVDRDASYRWLLDTYLAGISCRRDD